MVVSSEPFIVAPVKHSMDAMPKYIFRPPRVLSSRYQENKSHFLAFREGRYAIGAILHLRCVL
eukprot:scaffold4192_cov129-Skeletonema_marinoi.AAC.2